MALLSFLRSKRPLTLEEIRARVAAASWFQTFELVPGVVTPGVFEFSASYLLDHHYGAGRDLSGKTAIDIGAWDGAMAFELERRGAKVVALDIQDPAITGFNTAKSILGSHVEYVRGSVYDVRQLFRRSFDIVCFLGVWYHLYNPIGALKEVAGILAEDGRLFAEGECLLNYIENERGEASGLDARQLADADVPLTLCYPGLYKKASNWFVPNLACLRSWFHVADLEIMSCQTHGDQPPMQRATLVARRRPPDVEKVAGAHVEHPVFQAGWRSSFS
jgi:tRNA (mo5U34)-methyltransferase